MPKPALSAHTNTTATRTTVGDAAGSYTLDDVPAHVTVLEPLAWLDELSGPTLSTDDPGLHIEVNDEAPLGMLVRSGYYDVEQIEIGDLPAYVGTKPGGETERGRIEQWTLIALRVGPSHTLVIGSGVLDKDCSSASSSARASRAVPVGRTRTAPTCCHRRLPPQRRGRPPTPAL